MHTRLRVQPYAEDGHEEKQHNYLQQSFNTLEEAFTSPPT